MAGVVGGVAAYLSAHGATRRVRTAGGPKTAGFLQTAVIGGLAGLLAWAAEDPQSALALTQLAAPGDAKVGDLIASFGVGLAGSKWFTNHYDAATYRYLGAEGTSRGADLSAATALASGQLARASALLSGGIRRAAL